MYFIYRYINLGNGGSSIYYVTVNAIEKIYLGVKIKALNYGIKILIHLKLCLTAATQNLKLVKILT